MPKKSEKIKYEISEFCPTWIDKNFPTSEEYLAVEEIVRFYLINSPCLRSSSRGTDISVWGKPSIVLIDRIKDVLGLTKGTNYDYGKSKPEMKKLFDKYHLEKDFTNVTENMLIFFDNGNVVDFIFKHIRNAIAHSRWQVLNDIYYFEDGSDDDFEGETEFCVTARIVLKKESLIQLRDMIIAGPVPEELNKINQETILNDLSDKIRNMFKGKYFKRKEAIDALGINNDVWKKLYKKCKNDGIMKIDHGSWAIVK